MKKAWITLSLILVCGLTACGSDAAPQTDTVSPTQHLQVTFSNQDTEAAASHPDTAVSSAPTSPKETQPEAAPTTTAATEPVETEGSEPAVSETTVLTTEPPAKQPPATEPPTTSPPATMPPATQPVETQPPETSPPETTVPETQPPQALPTAEYKRQVAAYAAQYLNQYRAAAGVQSCTVLSGMTLVAEFRADQLCYNYSHSTADKRAALAYYEYGRWVDATLAGLDESDSYYESDTSEAIFAGFKGGDAEAMGKYIADMIRNSSSHWSYVGSSEYSFMGIGVEYREGSQYGWYGCVMVGTVNYG